MKKQKILQLTVMCAAMSVMSTQAALLGITPPSGSPFYADFTDSSLDVTYNYSGTSTSGSGTLTVVSHNGSIGAPTSNNAFVANANSPGTGPFSESGFSGYYTLSATILNNNGVYSVGSGGSFDIYGQLNGINGSTSDLLLSANLKTGANNFGYTPVGSPHSTGSIELDLLFSVTGGNTKIYDDFFGPIGGQGGIVLTTGTLSGVNGATGGYSGLNANFSNNHLGQANTFVPEPAAYPLVASVFAMLSFAGVVVSRRKQA